MIYKQISEKTAQRTDIAVYFDVTGQKGVTIAEPTGNEKAWAQAGAAWTSFTENPNAQTKTRKFINEKTERNNITRYSPQWAYEVLLMFERPEIAMVYDIVKQRKTGSDTIVTFVVVDLFKPTETDNEYEARLVKAAVQVSSLDDDDDMIMKGTLYNQGDEVLGTFNTSTGVFTSASAATEASQSSDKAVADNAAAESETKNTENTEE